MVAYSSNQLKALHQLRTLLKKERFDRYNLCRPKHPLEFIANYSDSGYYPTFIVRLYRGKIKIKIFSDTLTDWENNRFPWPHRVTQALEKLGIEETIILDSQTYKNLPEIVRYSGKARFKYYGYRRFVKIRELRKYSQIPRSILNVLTSEEHALLTTA